MPRTYWHLDGLGRMPNDYDIASSRLLYYRGRGFEVRTPIAEWYQRHQTGSALACDDWEQFRDPRETTYASYTELQRQQEGFVDGVLAAGEATGADRRFTAAWWATLDDVVAVLRYPAHGLQLLAAYVAQLAPSGRIVIAGLFQAGDELRRVQRLAYRMRQLQELDPGFGTASRAAWETAARWQPLREVIERMLVVRDWGEAFAALALALKPRFDAVFATQLGELARAAGDHTLGHVVFSLDADCRWHRDWSAALVRMAVAARPANATALARWLAVWDPAVERAIAAIVEPVFGGGATAAAALAAVDAEVRAHRAACGLPEGTP